MAAAVPIVTAMTHYQSILTSLPLPGQGGSVLNAVVKPPPAESDQLDPMAYIWPTTGPEKRLAVPRPLQGTPGTGSNQAGQKLMTHAIDIYVLWFQDQDGPDPDMGFLIIMDAILDALRCSTDGVTVQDPVTFRWSTLFAVGEAMTYDVGVPMATTRDQRILEYRGRVAAPCKEEFQA